jgi:hypothetical protein
MTDYNKNFNPLLLVMLIIVIIANVWLVVKEIYTGLIYFTFFTGIVVCLFLVNSFTASEPSHEVLSKIMRNPFGIYLGVACLSYLIGWIVPICFKIIFGLLGGGFSLVNYSIPLFGGKLLSGISQSFAVAQVEQSMAWKIFNLSFNAGTSEEFIFTFGLPFVFVALLWLFADKLNLKIKSSKYTILGIAVVLSVLMFMFSHSLNGTYNNFGMYLFAGLFKLVSLITTYVFPVGLTFWVGYHQSNNFLWLIDNNGIIPVLNGLISWVGLMMAVIFAFCLFVVVYKWKEINVRE